MPHAHEPDDDPRRTTLRALFGGLFHAEGEATLPEALEQALAFRTLERGEVLCREGEPADGVYLVLRGRLIAMPADPTRPIWSRVGPGETVGSWALFTDGTRSADVVAQRPTHVAHLSRAAFEALGARHPELFRRLASLAIGSMRKAQEASTPARPQVLALVALDESARVAAFPAALARALALLGTTVLVDADEHPDEPDALARDTALDARESAADYVVYALRGPLGAAAQRLYDRADQVVLLAAADGDATPGPREPLPRASDVRLRRPRSLVLIHDAATEQPRGTARWLDPRPLDQHHHVREDREGDVQRVARTLVRRGVGLVLSGGAALGAAHLGVLAALAERGVPIDYTGGTSAGAGVAAMLALHRSYEETHDMAVRNFVEKNPIGRPTLPLISLVAGAPLDRTAQQMFGDLCVEDLWIPWFGVATGLGSGERKVLRRGLLRKATRATSAVPGLMPPVPFGDELLVDGGVVDNFPSQTMRELFGGTILGCDVQPAAPTRPAESLPDTLPGPFTLLRERLLGAGAPRFPSLVRTLSRVATIGHRAGHAQQRAACDLYLAPPLRGFGLTDFARFPAMAAIGHAHAVEVLADADLTALVPGWGAGTLPNVRPPAPTRGPASARFGRRSR